MDLITKEGAFKVFYCIIAADGTIAAEESEKLDEIGLQLFGENFVDVRDGLLADCETQTASVGDDPDEIYELLSENIEDALNDKTDEPEKGIPSRMLLWNLLLIAHSDGSFDQSEKRLMRKINRKMNIGDSVLFEMEQYISTVGAIEKELERLSDSMEPYKLVRPVVDELENRRETIRQAVMALIEDEVLNPLEKLTVQDDFIDKAQAAIKDSAAVKKVNEQTNKILGDVKKAAAPAAAEAGKKIGKAFMGFGSKLMNRNSSDINGKE